MEIERGNTSSCGAALRPSALESRMTIHANEGNMEAPQSVETRAVKERKYSRRAAVALELIFFTARMLRISTSGTNGIDRGLPTPSMHYKIWRQTRKLCGWRTSDIAEMGHHHRL